MAQARRALPHPAARAVHLVGQAHRPKDQYEALLHAAEIIASTLTLTSAALVRAELESPVTGPGLPRDKAERQLSTLRNAYLKTGPTFGTWTNWLGALNELLSSSPALMPGLLDSLLPSEGDGGLHAHLLALKNERNQASHGSKPRIQEEAALRIEESADHFNRLLSGSRCLGDMPWLLTLSSAYRSRDHTFEVTANRVMGNNPDFERSTHVFSAPTADRTMYVLTPRGPVSLSPFVASRFCHRCLQYEVCHTCRLDKETEEVLLKSFASGHEIRDGELAEEVRALPEGRKGK